MYICHLKEQYKNKPQCTLLSRQYTVKTISFCQCLYRKILCRLFRLELGQQNNVPKFFSNVCEFSIMFIYWDLLLRV